MPFINNNNNKTTFTKKNNSYVIGRKSEGNKEKSICPTLARKRKYPKSWQIWKEKGREGRAGVILSAPQHTRGNRADRGETRSELHRGGEGPARPRPPSAEDRGEGERGLHPGAAPAPLELPRAGSREAQPGVGPRAGPAPRAAPVPRPILRVGLRALGVAGVTGKCGRN